MGEDWLQLAPDVCIAREQPGLKLRTLPQLPVEIVAGKAIGFVDHQALAPTATTRDSARAAARTPTSLAMAGRRGARALAQTAGSSNGAAGTWRDRPSASVPAVGSRVDWPDRGRRLPPTCPRCAFACRLSWSPLAKLVPQREHANNGSSGWACAV